MLFLSFSALTRRHGGPQQIGHVVVNSTTDRPWSQYFCCMVAANREFVAQASRRPPSGHCAAILKATDICALRARPGRAIRRGQGLHAATTTTPFRL